MPVLEAMSCGAVVLSSNVSSIPEILQDDRFLVDPKKEGDLSNRMINLYKSDNQQIIKKNINASRAFSWEKHGNVLGEVIKGLL